MINNLDEYRKQIESLSEEDLKKRDGLLISMAKGETFGPLTGFSSLDKTRLKYYKMDKYYDLLVKKTVTEAFYSQNSQNLDNVALEYFFSKITYKKFFEEIEKLAKAFQKNNVQKGDYVSICSAGIPEAMYAIYALGYFGAVGIYLPPYLNKETMINDINKNNSKILLVMDLFYSQYKDLFDEVKEKTSLEKIVIVPTLNSSILGKLQKEKHFPNTKNYNEFLEEGKKEVLSPMAPYEKDMPAAVVYSSGTTGDLKGVLLSHDSINNSAASYSAFGFDLNPDQKIYQAIPVWSSTGLVAVGTTPLFYGATLHQNPQFDPIVYSKNLGLNRDNWGIGTTELFGGLLDLKDDFKFKMMLKLHILDYKELRNTIIGGTFSTPNDRERLNKVLAQIGSPAKIRASYGTCENGSIVSAELNGVEHPDYSVGIPIPGTEIFAIDENYQELPYYQRGELVVKTDNGMLRYYNRPELNKIFIQGHENLRGFKHTGDIGYIVPSGDVIYEGRANDVSVVNEETIYNFDVKKAILNDKDVFDCEVFLHPTEDKLCANIVFFENSPFKTETNTEILKDKMIEIQKMIKQIFGDENYIPEFFKIRDCFPMAASTKRDFKKIKSETDGYIYLSKKDLLNDKALRRTIV